MCYTKELIRLLMDQKIIITDLTYFIGNFLQYVYINYSWTKIHCRQSIERNIFKHTIIIFISLIHDMQHLYFICKIRILLYLSGTQVTQRLCSVSETHNIYETLNFMLDTIIYFR